MENKSDNYKFKLDKAKKMMLWFGMISLTMSFLGITSGYIVSKERPDWLNDFQIPPAFYISLVIIIISSFTFYLAIVQRLRSSCLQPCFWDGNNVAFLKALTSSGRACSS